jgi:hypothetical protein
MLSGQLSGARIRGVPPRKHVEAPAPLCFRSDADASCIPVYISRGEQRRLRWLVGPSAILGVGWCKSSACIGTSLRAGDKVRAIGTLSHSLSVCQRISCCMPPGNSTSRSRIGVIATPLPNRSTIDTTACRSKPDSASHVSRFPSTLKYCSSGIDGAGGAAVLQIAGSSMRGQGMQSQLVAIWSCRPDNGRESAPMGGSPTSTRAIGGMNRSR